jgi:AraC family transcriptional regulator of adaptative response / DNA-3-methyladenine glycosylase II
MSELYPYQSPFYWTGTLEFLKTRLIKNIELVKDEFYARTIRIGKHTGWIKVTHAPEKHSLRMEHSSSLAPVLPMLQERLRNQFDLSATPDLINAHLAKHKLLKASVAKHPGLRVLGTFDEFEMAIRAIIGQQITVKAATTISCRFANAYGEKITTPFSELSRLTPPAQIIAKATIDDIAKLGIVSARAKCIIALAQAFVSGSLQLEPGLKPEVAIEQLVKLPGIGPWTAHYIAMRGLRWLDAFPKEDVAVRNALGGMTAKEAEALSQLWRPYRSYAVFHLWMMLSETQTN